VSRLPGQDQGRNLKAPAVTKTLIAALMSLTSLLPAAARDTVTWMTEDLPPEFIYRGPSEGQGTGDLSIRFIAERLPGYEHRVIRADTARIFYQMARQDGVCYWGAWRTPERQVFARFSNRPLPGPSFRLIVSEDRMASLKPYLTEQGEIDLAALGAGGLTGGYVTGQPYPGVVGDFVAAPGPAVRLEPVTQVSRLYGLVGAGRVDFVIGNGIETRYYLSHNPSARKFHALPIKGAPPATVGYVACSKGAIGGAVIDAVDRLLSDDATWAAYLAPMRRWGDESDYRAALAARPEKK